MNITFTIVHSSLVLYSVFKQAGPPEIIQQLPYISHVKKAKIACSFYDNRSATQSLSRTNSMIKTEMSKQSTFFYCKNMCDCLPVCLLWTCLRLAVNKRCELLLFIPVIIVFFWKLHVKELLKPIALLTNRVPVFMTCVIKSV